MQKRFEKVCLIHPYLDLNGEVFQERVYNKYDNNNDLDLHAYGKGPYCRFSISKKWNGKSGVYIFTLNEKPVYIGQTINFGKRINHGYGKIYPRNCFVKGQSTNCRINSLILQSTLNSEELLLFFYETKKHLQIELELIQKYKPNWNKANNLKRINTEPKTIKNIKNPSIKQVRKHINSIIKNGLSNGLLEVKIRAGDIHKELEMDNAVPTVCNAMRSLGSQYLYDVKYTPPKGSGTNLKYIYRKNNRIE